MRPLRLAGEAAVRAILWGLLSGSDTRIYLRYQQDLSAVRFLVERWGIGRFIELYRRLGRVRVAPGTARYHLRAALRKTIGIGLASFERRWADSIVE